MRTRYRLWLTVVFAPTGPAIVRRGWRVRDGRGRLMPWPRIACTRIVAHPWPFNFHPDSAFALTFTTTLAAAILAAVLWS